MKVSIQSIDDNFLLEATNEAGHTMQLDGAPGDAVSPAFRPMQAVLSALGGCSAIDVVMILQKGKLEVKGIKVDMNADRYDDRTPKIFKKIHCHYTVTGDLPEAKVERAVKLSMEKYCSVAKIIEKTAEITWSFEIVNP